MFDVHNAGDENEDDADLVRRFFPYIRHVHVNERNGAEPGRGDYRFESLLAAFRALDYDRWISVEAFDFSRPSFEIASGALDRLRTAAESI